MAYRTTFDEQPGVVTRVLGRLVDVKPDEVRAMLLGAAYFFFILCSYYIIRPIRDTMGITGGVRNLPWMFTGTLIGMLIANPIFSAAVARYPRKRFIPMTYRFFMLNLLLFFILLHTLRPDSQVWLARLFFIWVSVFNLYVVSVFWGFMTDLFHSEQGKRLFGFIGVGGTLGAIFGSSITALFAHVLSAASLMLVSMVFLEVAVQCVRWLGRVNQPAANAPAPGDGEAERPTPTPERAIGGSSLAGITHVLRSPYLIGICIYMLLFTIGSTFLYFEQEHVVAATISGQGSMTGVFARIDLMVNTLTLLIQAFFTGRILKWLGVTATLALLPAVSMIGFLGLGLMPVLAVVIAFQVLRRAGNFAVARPTREVLFTVIPREDKYKAKSLIDTFVYRSGDQIGAWSYALMGVLGLAVAGTALVAVPLSALWLLVSVWLGHRQQVLATAQDQADVPPPSAQPALA